MAFNNFAFNESMYTEVTQHLFHWYINGGTKQPHDMISFVSDNTHVASFTSNNRPKIPTKKRKSDKPNCQSQRT